jgi:hypothetical protein
MMWIAYMSKNCIKWLIVGYPYICIIDKEGEVKLCWEKRLWKDWAHTPTTHPRNYLFLRSCLARFVLRKKRDGTTAPTNIVNTTRTTNSHATDTSLHLTTRTTQHDQSGSPEMMEHVALHHGGHISAPHRARLNGGIESRPTLSEAAPAMVVTATNARGGPTALSKKPPKSWTSHMTRDVPSTRPPLDLPLLHQKTDQSDH